MSVNTIFIADDHQIVIDGLQLLLNDNDRFKIIGSANDGETALKHIIKLNPDVVLLDLKMPEKDGLQVILHLKNQGITSKIIMLSMHGDRRFIIDAKHYGADAFLLKNVGKAELILTIEKVLNGEQVFTKFPELSSNDNSVLTPRELEVIELIVNGLTSNQIAESLNLSHYTIETHRKNIVRKTGAKNSASLVKYVMDHKINI